MSSAQRPDAADGAVSKPPDAADGAVSQPSDAANGAVSQPPDAADGAANQPPDAAAKDTATGTGAAKGAPSQAELAMYRSMRTRLIVVTLAVGVLGCALGVLLRGLPGLWGALLATGIGVLFMATTVIVVGWVARRSPQLMMAAMLGSWLGKMVLAFLVVVAIRGLTFYDRDAFMITLAAVVIAALAIEASALLRAREAYAVNP